MIVWNARNGVKDKLPNVWAVVKHQFDSALCFDFEAQANTRSRISSYLGRRSAELSLFCDEKDIETLMNVEGPLESEAHCVARCMQRCEVMRTMLSSVWLACSRQIFRDKVKTQLVALEREDFSEDRRRQFEAMMGEESRRLRAEGHSRGKHKFEALVEMFNVDVPVTIDFAADEWELCFWGRVRSIALNTGQLAPRLPWEDWLVPKGSLPGVPETLQLPETILAPLKSARGDFLEVLEGSENTLKDATKVMRKNYTQLTEAHVLFKLDMAFLETKAEGMLRSKVRVVCNSHVPRMRLR